jgi:hypothetical protein
VRRKEVAFLLFLVLGAGAAAAQENEREADEADRLFAPPGGDQFGTDAVPGARERFAEALARAARELAKDPLDAAAMERAVPLAERLGRQALLADRLRAALRAPEADEAKRGKLARALGHLLARWADQAGFRPWRNAGGGVVIVIRQAPDGTELRREAAEALRAALRADPKDERSLADLLEVLHALGSEAHRDEIADLERRLAGVAGPRAKAVEPAGGSAFHGRAQGLVREAYALETREAPDHDAALELRRKALVFGFCDRTIPFAYEASLFEPVSLLADPRTIEHFLTRSYRRPNGDLAQVPPVHFPAPASRRREIVDRLAANAGAGACAALLAVIFRAEADPQLAGHSVGALARAAPAPLLEHLPAVLRYAMEEASLGFAARRLLVDLAARLRHEPSAPVLRDALARDEDLEFPLDVALALGRIGRAEDAGALLACAADASRDAYFRRRAVDALAQIAPARLLDLPGDPELEVAILAARLRAGPDDAARARLLRALASEHQADDAAAYCVELRLAEAVPALEAAIAEREDYAVDALRAALKALREE